MLCQSGDPRARDFKELNTKKQLEKIRQNKKSKIQVYYRELDKMQNTKIKKNMHTDMPKLISYGQNCQLICL